MIRPILRARVMVRHLKLNLLRRLIVLAVTVVRGRELVERYVLLDRVFGFIDDCRIEGAYLEFGCAFGGSMSDVYHIARSYKLDSMRFYGFDSFRGLPALTGLDAGSACRYRKGQFACGLEQYRRNLKRWGVDLSRVELTGGWYADTLKPDLKETLSLERAAVVLIDCDLYESTIPVLDFITDLIQNGTILIFDDWFSYKGRNDLGEAKAFSEWLARNPGVVATEYHKCGRTMMSFVMQVRQYDSL